ncbi:MAG: haloacid dehalogenase type II [Thermodesulfobacteriota bacterium]
MTTRTRPAALFFDLNETLLDLTETKASISDCLGGRDGLTALWFSTLLHHSLVMTVSGQFAPFGEIAVSALMMVARSHDIALSEEAAKNAIRPIRSAPPHPDVIQALQRLREENFRMGVLTNSAANVMKQQLATAEIDEFFDFRLSVEENGIYKPHRDVYRWAAAQEQLDPSDCMMIAAHGWDVGGAAWAGMRTAFVARPGQPLFPLAPSPEIVEPDMGKAAERLIGLPG